MPNLAGTHLGPYEILSPLGAGGMGEVWKARDARLDRIVAVKVSSGQFSERFDREARAVASLNHPHICTLHDVGANYLVMEYIEGHALKGPVPLAQALEYAAQICGALDAAHKRGIVHRDLKPANIMVTKSGVKLLDFGLAKLTKAVAADGRTDTIALTQAHTILGTLQYMAPEQLEGKEADARSDIFAFGAVLYEMLAGRPAFQGKTNASLIAAILEHDPPSVADSIPHPLDRLIRRCLAKDPERRWESARDLKAELEWIAEQGAGIPATAAIARGRWVERAAWIAVLVLLCLTLWFWPRPTASEVVRFAIYPPDRTAFSSPRNITVATPQFELSPDGRSIVFVASTPGGKPTLWLRSLADVSARPIPATEGAEFPFWAPDSRWIGFFSEDKLKKVPVDGGAVQQIGEGFADPRGVSWGPGDTILISQGTDFLSRIPSSGGTPTPATSLDAAAQERVHRWPQFLPDGRHFIFTIQSELKDRRGAYVGSMDGKTKKYLIALPNFGSTEFATPGYLLFLNEDTLMTQRFDTERLSLLEQPLTVAEHVGRSTGGKIAVSASRTGVLAYADGMFKLGRLVWFDRAGNRLGAAPSPEGDYSDFRISPDGKRLAVSLVERKTGLPDVWLVDEARGGMYRFTYGPALNAGAVWSADGTQVVFRSNRRGLVELWRKSAAGGGAEAVILHVDTLRSLGVSVSTSVAGDWSPDGVSLLCSMASPLSGFDLWLAPTSGDGKPVKFLDAPYDQIHGNFSPNGKLVAFSSNESGKFEVYVQTYPRSDRQWQVSIDGGSEPRWRKDGQEIYFLSQDRKLMAVPVGAGPSFGVPHMLFQTHTPVGVQPMRSNYVPSADGKRFLVNTQSDQPPTPITVVLNWVAGLKR